MIDVRLTATNPEDSTLVPVPCNSRGELLTVAPKIEAIPNDVDIQGDLTVAGTINGAVFPDSSGGIDLPPDPYEGALLGWLNGGLAWIGTPPIPVPPGRFGPITAWDPEGRLVVEGEIPEQIKQGVYIYQCNEDGSIYVEGWDNSQKWSTGYFDLAYGAEYASVAFNGKLTDYSQVADTSDGGGYNFPGTLNGSLIVYTTTKTPTSGSSTTVTLSNGMNQVANRGYTQDYEILDFGNVTNITSIKLSNGGLLWGVSLNGDLLVDDGEYPTAPNLNFRVQSVIGQAMIGSSNRTENFTVGKYLRIPEQNVARWLYDGNLTKVITSTGIDISRLTEN